jgi:hypothetical protein
LQAVPDSGVWMKKIGGERWLQVWRIEDARAANQVFASIYAIHTLLSQHFRGEVAMDPADARPKAGQRTESDLKY